MRGKWTVCFSWLLLFHASFVARAQSQPTANTIEAFFNAIEQNDTNTTFKMLEADANLTRGLYAGHLPLHTAAAEGHLQIVQQLLKHGADINAQNDAPNTSNAQLTPLEAAISYNQPEICKYLLEAGADPNIQSSFDGSALHYALTHQQREVAGWLLDYGANPFLEKGNLYNKTTPFELAIMQGQGGLVPRMLEIGRTNFSTSRSHPRRTETKPSLSDFLTVHGTALLSAAAERGELEAVQALLKSGVSAKGTNQDGSPVLQSFAVATAAAAKGRPAGISQLQRTREMLKEQGTNALPFLVSEEAQQAARVEASSPERLLQIRNLLTRAGADYDAFAATALGDLPHVRDLLVEDKNVTQSRDRNGQTPLHWAVLNDQPSMTSFWLQAGVPPGATNTRGQTALHQAAERGLVEHVKLLLAARAPTDIRDTNGQTALELAEAAKQTQAIRLLLPNNAAVGRLERAASLPIHQAAASGNIATLAVLTESTNDLEARNELGLTPLEVAVQNGHLAAAALLVDKGADVNARDPDGNTMLHQIILKGFGVYASDQPPPNWLDRLGQNQKKEIYQKYLTPDREHPPNSFLQVVSFVLACGVDMNATNHAGQKVMQMATDEKILERLPFSEEDRSGFLQLLNAGGGDVNLRDDDGNTALHRVVSGNNGAFGEKTRALIAAGADVNATNNEGRTPLHLAVANISSWYEDADASSNHALLVLLSAKPNVNAQDNDGLTPLHLLGSSTNSFRKGATEALLRAGANPNLCDKHGRTALHAFLSGTWPWAEVSDSIKLLVQAGADLSARDDQGRTPLHYLAGLGHESPMFFIHDIGEVLKNAKNLDLQARDNDGNTALHIAARTGTKDVFDWLVKQGLSLDATNNLGETPRSLLAHNWDPFRILTADTDIVQAAREGKVDALASLTKMDPSLVNQSDRFGQTPLRAAVSAHRTNAVEFLERHGAHWDAISAILIGRTDILRQILTNQPSAITNSVAGGDLLHLAALRDDLDCVRILLDAGADVHTTDLNGLSPLGIALQRKQLQLAALLRRHRATENPFDAIENEDAAVLGALVAKNKSVATATNISGSSLLEAAAGAGNTNAILLLLKRRVSVNATNRLDGRTPLHAAAANNQSAAAKLLVERGAFVEAYDRRGFTPLHLAAIAGAAETARVLLEHKANPDVPVIEGAPQLPMMHRAGTLTGDSALHLAALYGETDVLQLLLERHAAVNAVNAAGFTPLDLARMRGIPPLSLFVSGIKRSGGPVDIPGQYLNRQKAAADLLEKAGGKHGTPKRSAGYPPGFSGPGAFLNQQ